jgi:hypothetical protein
MSRFPVTQGLNFYEIPENAKYLSFVTERFVMSQTERKYKTLEFFHSLEVRL